MASQDSTGVRRADEPGALPGEGVVFVFVDGIGVGPEGPHNPFSFEGAPALEALAGGPLVDGTPTVSEPNRVYRRLDATLGVPGLPQSATGQTALFAGANGAAALGRHVTAFPGATLQGLIRQGSLFLCAERAGLPWAFANVRTRAYFEALENRRLRRSVTGWAVEAAGGAHRDEDDLRRGRAVSWDIVRDRIELEGPAAPIEPSEAGRHLAAICREASLVVYETFLTDFAGHGRFGLDPSDVLRRVDGLVEGLLEELPSRTTLVLTSDHGNFEDLGTRGHTLASVPLLASGPGARRFDGATGLLDVYPAILECLGLERPAEEVS